MGFGLIKVVNKKMEFLQLNELILSKYDDHYTKLKVIFERTIELIETHHPDEIAIEAPFFGKNVQSMLKLGRAQGVAMAAGLSRQIPITEYEPKKIKMAITGNGNASKEQVAKMFNNIAAKYDLLNHSFDDAIFLKNGWYYVEKIYSADLTKEQSVKVDLIRLNNFIVSPKDFIPPGDLPQLWENISDNWEVITTNWENV